MINIDEARGLVAASDIPFPKDWKDQMLKLAEDSIRQAAGGGKKMTTINGRVSDRGYQKFFISPEQFKEIVGVLEQNGFRVDEYFKYRHDGQPIYVDVFW